MTKSIIITYKEADENFLMTFLKKMKVKTSVVSNSDSDEITIVRQRLHDRYVVSGEWSQMSDEDREDAAHAETMIYAREQPDHHVFSIKETEAYFKNFEKKLRVNADR